MLAEYARVGYRTLDDLPVEVDEAWRGLVALLRERVRLGRSLGLQIYLNVNTYRLGNRHEN